MDAQLFQKQLDDLVKEAEKALQTLTPQATTEPKRLHEAMRYSLDAGGKRLRPVLCLASAKAFRTDADARYAATAIECIHTYSLIHDDLPCMDNSDLRRGRPSCHKAFDEATALLAGDALIPLAFKLLTQGYGDNPTLVQQLVGELAEAAGSTLLVGGQSEDMNTANKKNQAEKLEFILQGKTAAMLSVSLSMGARVGGASPRDIEHFKIAGQHAGIAFQLVDDLLDTQGSSAHLGKPVGADKNNGKLTYVNLYGVEATQSRIKKLTEEAIQHLKACEANTDFLCALITQMASRKN
jgi:geranylgeranyl pyrophosphate synthase